MVNGDRAASQATRNPATRAVAVVRGPVAGGGAGGTAPDGVPVASVVARPTW
ncbi:hypothetical protein [Frankia nepalensis]|uniref:hypothetical protein n=1 Tax=Frankia nepalensis TaxID=1836974 RepID=UPI001EE4E632|nr:hypothetical protein [Frankia nepalensis]